MDQSGYAVDSRGNQLLVREQFPLHTGLDIESRKRASPLVFFRGIPHAGRVKGHVEFQGFGLIERAEFVSQLDQQSQRAFSNVRYDFIVMSLVSEGEEFDWDWINARRDPNLTNDDCLSLAPAAWRWWVKYGSTSLPRVRRMLSRLRTVSATDQRPPDDSKQGRTLGAITQHYANRKHRFELLAEHVVQDVVITSGMDYVRGWITPASGDGGADFIASRCWTGAQRDQASLARAGQMREGEYANQREPHRAHRRSSPSGMDRCLCRDKLLFEASTGRGHRR